jgi:hypothetical protein
MNVAKEVAQLERMSPKELRVRYAEVCGEATNTHNKAWLVRRIAWRLQANVKGGLAEQARARATELANDADLRVTEPKARPALATPQTPTSALLPGTVLTRAYKGRNLRVMVLDDGFEFEGEVFQSLSGVAKHVTGSHCSGNLFFKVKGGAK